MKNIWAYIFLLVIGITAQGAYAQMYNYGSLYIDTGGKIGIHADFTNTGTATLTDKGNIYALKNVKQDGITGYDGGTLRLVGSNLQTISGQEAFKTTGLQFSNTAGFHLLKKISVSQDVEFTDGIVLAVDSLEPLEFNPDGTGATAILPVTPSDASHVNGYVSQTGTGNFDYPVGDGTRYQPVKANISMNPEGLMARYYPDDGGDAPRLTTGLEAVPLLHYNQMEYWDLQPVNNAGVTAVVTVYYDDYHNAGIGTDYLSALKVAHKIVPGWQNEGGVVNGTQASGSVSSIGALYPQGKFTLGSITEQTPLPVVLSGFEALVVNCNVILKWHSGSETNVAGYYIQYSTDGISFADIDSTDGQGDNSSYSYTHQPQQKGMLLYRIAVKDKNGNLAYTDVVSVMVNCGSRSISIYPNPVTYGSNLYVVLDGYGAAAAEIYDMLGRRILDHLPLNDGKNVIDVNTLAVGAYHLIVYSKDSRESFKIVVER
ncbi:T9SS type A sorting domain-containing protein [Taibaiella lutea]|uniref:T9SS type A sorting domain-containing protein n=1 Tax=Taibaiella lutea TaxID=2608001 RepID=A0A5M6CI64_9BACT|nr:T9SS type A sorting domain-containing protein [Taibaiella lutea]KAA5534713.1 T9SS type A sorting domain-containing protein [Taibaiella lutea]